jgi:hypothetical protein
MMIQPFTGARSQKAGKTAMILVLAKASGRQRRENVSAGKRAEAFPDVCPLHVASSQWAQVTNREVNVDDTNNDRSDRM